ncbi:MAG TPA: porin family protein [Caulobacteraceae bacterium]
MKKFMFAAAASALAFAAMPAAAADWYAQVNAGYTVSGDADVDASFTPDDTDFDPMSGSVGGDIDNGFLVGAAAGMAVGNGLRVEAEGVLGSNDMGDIEDLDLSGIEYKHAALFANVLYDFPMGGVTPYIGAGIGYGSSTFDIDGDSVHDQGTVWQIKAGASFPVNDTLTVDIGYRYMEAAKWEASMDDVDIDDDPDAGPGTARLSVDPAVHALTVGARFKLGGGA